MDAKFTGKIIQTKRKELGLTQIQLADKLNVSNRAISKWENGDGYPDVSILEDVANVLGITIDELLTGKAPEKEIEYIEIAKETDYQNEDKSKLNFIIMSIIGFALLIGQTVACLATEMSLVRYRPFYMFIEIYLLAAIIVVYVISIIIYFVGLARYKYYNDINTKVKNYFWLFIILASVSPVAIIFRMTHWLMPDIKFVVLGVWVILVATILILLLKRIKNK